MEVAGTKLTPAAVSEILRKEEFSSGDLYPEGMSSVRFFETNTLASNRPLEDSHSEAILHPSKPNDPPGIKNFCTIFSFWVAQSMNHCSGPCPKLNEKIAGSKNFFTRYAIRSL